MDAIHPLTPFYVVGIIIFAVSVAVMIFGGGRR